jgi:hypothetical protein
MKRSWEAGLAMSWCCDVVMQSGSLRVRDGTLWREHYLRISKKIFCFRCLAHIQQMCISYGRRCSWIASWRSNLCVAEQPWEWVLHCWVYPGVCQDKASAECGTSTFLTWLRRLLILLIKNFTGYRGVLHLYYSLYAVQVLSSVPLHVIDLFPSPMRSWFRILRAPGRSPLCSGFKVWIWAWNER